MTINHQLILWHLKKFGYQYIINQILQTFYNNVLEVQLFLSQSSLAIFVQESKYYSWYLILMINIHLRYSDTVFLEWKIGIGKMRSSLDHFNITCSEKVSFHDISKLCMSSGFTWKIVFEYFVDDFLNNTWGRTNSAHFNIYRKQVCEHYW